MADRGFDVRVDPAVHAAYPEYVALVLRGEDAFRLEGSLHLTVAAGA